MSSLCPGQDNRNLKVELYKCPNCGAEEEIFLVADGPQQVDNYTWWYLVGPFDESRHGWAVANFLRVVQNP